MGNGADDKPNARSAAAFENADLDRLPGLLRNGARIQRDQRRRRARQSWKTAHGKTPDEFGGVMQKRPLDELRNVLFYRTCPSFTRRAPAS
jgi:hypothetical protein